MPIYRPKKSPYYHFDFQWRGNRFHGSTKRTSRREAEAVERAERERARQDAAKAIPGAALLTLDAACGRYWQEVGQHHAGKENTWRDLERLLGYFGASKLLSDITDDEVAKLVAWRRGHTVTRHRKPGAKLKQPDPLVSNATVNRSTTEVLKKVFTCARVKWRKKFDREPIWKQHRLPEPKERVRELLGDEGDRLAESTREDYDPFFDFARASGLRLRECFLRWPEVNWDAGQIVKKGKGGKTITVPITPVIRTILWPLRGHHPHHVFTYVAVRTRKERVRGRRYPVTYNGVKSLWKRVRKAAGVTGFRFHDFRHDLGTKLLRKTGNLKLVQRALNHSDIKTTTRYAHVLDDEVAAALQDHQESRNKSRSAKKKAG